MASLQPSINIDANLIIGQVFQITITVTSDYDIAPNDYIEFKDSSKNITVPTGKVNLSNYAIHDTKVAVFSTFLTIARAPSLIKPDDEITFIVDSSIDDATPLQFKCIAKTLKDESSSLVFDNIFLKTPNEAVASDSPQKTKVSTLLVDEDSNSLSGVPVFIGTEDKDDIHYFDITDENNMSVKTISMGNFIGFYINSDKKGNVVFYLQPKQEYSMVTYLRSFVVKPIKSGLLQMVLGGDML
ncbi:MAG: hypothetical protein LBI71_02090 [Enterobacteriaceae bacterium]|jgi:hypothetical protein|nr:hypothetical protein [Enterobacteriaceae bacterium]